VGTFSIPLEPRLAIEGKLRISHRGSDPTPLVILFDKHDGKAGYQIIRDLKDSVTLNLPEPIGNVDQLRRELEENLTALGLYPKEARAMLETWRDSWFEDGTRVFYVLPPKMVDEVLPLRIAPVPRETARVFVGRIEVLSPWMEQELETALTTGDVSRLEKYGRFLNPFLEMMQRRHGNVHGNSALAKIRGDAPGCAQ